MISYCIKKYFDKNVKKMKEIEQEWTNINETAVSFNNFFVDDFELRDFLCAKKNMTKTLNIERKYFL